MVAGRTVLPRDFSASLSFSVLSPLLLVSKRLIFRSNTASLSVSHSVVATVALSVVDTAAAGSGSTCEGVRGVKVFSSVAATRLPTLRPCGCVDCEWRPKPCRIRGFTTRVASTEKLIMRTEEQRSKQNKIGSAKAGDTGSETRTGTQGRPDPASKLPTCGSQWELRFYYFS